MHSISGTVNILSKRPFEAEDVLVRIICQMRCNSLRKGKGPLRTRGVRVHLVKGYLFVIFGPRFREDVELVSGSGEPCDQSL